ncbi:hypothetical protein SAMN05216409_11582 [Pseudomonas lutea]|uniref:Uncharacterized protein n=1 Tax=Pseudomonas lutea TaxID=243924 RepID=A0A9X8MGI8_9PSED|nr:hypothetical protein SAMN05216409_11582 [Pseudomonas lutea]
MRYAFFCSRNVFALPYGTPRPSIIDSREQHATPAEQSLLRRRAWYREALTLLPVARFN